MHSVTSAFGSWHEGSFQENPNFARQLPEKTLHKLLGHVGGFPRSVEAGADLHSTDDWPTLEPGRRSAAALVPIPVCGGLYASSARFGEFA
jgi:hypothetical protein